jgi:hypothetical protein
VKKGREMEKNYGRNEEKNEGRTDTLAPVLPQHFLGNTEQSNNNVSTF